MLGVFFSIYFYFFRWLLRVFFAAQGIFDLHLHVREL